MPSVVYEAAFRLYDHLTFERYYWIAREIIVQKVIWRRCELQAILVNSFYLASLHLIFFWNQVQPWFQVALFDFVSLFHTLAYVEVFIILFLTLSSWVLREFYFKPNALFTEYWLESLKSHVEQTKPNFAKDRKKSRRSIHWWNHVIGYYQQTVRFEAIKQICLVALRFFRSCQISIYAFFALCQLLIVRQLVVLQITDALSFFGLILVSLCGELHLCLYYIAFQCCAYACTLFLGLFIVVSLLIFNAFDRSNGLLRRHRCLGLPMRRVTYYRFTITHTRLFCETICVNRMISKFYYLFNLVSLPMNALMLMTVLMGRFKINMLPFALLIIFLLSTTQLFFHFMLVGYNRAIHQHSKLLMHLSACGQFDQTSYVRALLHLDLYVAKFHTRNQYGITNGPLGVVSNRNVARKVFFYFRMLMFSYHFVRRFN